MIMQEEIKQYLEEIARNSPNIVTGKLELGTRVKKSCGLFYEIDDLNIDKRLGDFPDGTVPYGPIHRALRSSIGGILKLFNGSSIIPFSRAYEAGVGECLEKAILVQLSSQRGREAFLVTGVLAEDKDLGVGIHSYNVVFRDGKPFLVDAENPLAKNADGKITHPYIAPITGIENGDFKVPEEWRQGRTYSLS